jgi:hypothetical protein
MSKGVGLVSSEVESFPEGVPVLDKAEDPQGVDFSTLKVHFSPLNCPVFSFK